MKEKIERLSKEQLDEKQRLILGLSEKLLDALKSSELFKNGLENENIAFDVLMGIGCFTASILDAADRCTGGEGSISNFYTEEILPTSCKMYKELTNAKKFKDKMAS